MTNTKEVLFNNAAELISVCKAIESAELNQYRNVCADALYSKRSGMVEASPSNAAKLVKYEFDVRNGKHDAALKVMLACGVPADFFNRTVRGGGESFNVYGIPKALMLAPLMLSDAPMWGGTSDANTLRGTILGLLAGAHNAPKGLPHYLNEYMNSLNKGVAAGSYMSGGTQSSSSCHALAAMGVLEVPSQGQYRIPSNAALDVLKRLVGIVDEDAPKGRSKGRK